MRNVRPKKSLGQHFLTDLSIAERIAATLDGYRGMPVLEVGPGMGVLTQFLAERGHDLTVVELDRESVAYLRHRFPELDGRIVEADFLSLRLDDFTKDHSLCVIGNYPYNISSQIFFHVLEYRDIVKCCSGMLQKEVAERIAAKPGSKTYGILSVLIQAWYDVEYCFTVEPHVFNPPPKVKSGVVKLTRNAIADLGCDHRAFRTVVKTAFGQRRKTLRNSLRAMFAPRPDLLADPLFDKRPEQLSVAQFIELTKTVESIQPAKEK